MPTIEVPAGTIAYEDSGGSGPVLVLTHGFPMDHRQWRKVVPLLDGVRCVLPTLPLGAHRTPMRPGADLTQGGQARILADFLEALDLDDVTVVMNDWGGPQFMVALGCDQRVGSMVLVACEAFDNFPPRQARPAALLASLPGGTWVLTQFMRTPLARHGKRGYGPMSRARIPEDVLDAWFEPARLDAGVRRDLRAFATGTPPRRTLLEWNAALAGFDRPALVVWPADDDFFPPEHGPRLAELLPQGRLVEIAGTGPLIPEDQPEELARVLLEFVLH